MVSEFRVSCGLKASNHLHLPAERIVAAECFKLVWCGFETAAVAAWVVEAQWLATGSVPSVVAETIGQGWGRYAEAALLAEEAGYSLQSHASAGGTICTKPMTP